MPSTLQIYQPLELPKLEQQIRHSWERSRQAGLERNLDPGVSKASPSELKRKRAHLRSLLHLAQDAFLPKYSQAILDSGSRVMLCDAKGMILESWGSEAFLTMAQKVALEPGCRWSEEARGTNAIGTALVEKSPSLVLSGDHFLSSLEEVSCAASPITDGQGGITAVLDISGHHAEFSGQKVHLAQMMSLDLENLLMQKNFAHTDQIYFTSYLNSPAGGLLCFEDGHLVAANRVALLTFQLRPPWSKTKVEDLFFNRQVCRQEGQTQLTKSRGGYLFTRFLKARPQARPLVLSSTADPRLEKAEKLGVLALDEGIPLLIQGETGSGKEVLVRALHGQSKRAHGPLVALNCAALPENLAESELFGHVPGAFTGAAKEGAKGKIREAQGGILFLDEIAELSLRVQAKVLRALQEKQVTPLGSHQVVNVDFTLVAASHKDLSQEVKRGSFREDLYFRLSGLEVCLPPLRQRQDFEHLLQQLLHKYGPGKRLAPGLFKQLAGYGWPGNLRQLDQVLKVACALAGPEAEIRPCHLPDRLWQEITQGPSLEQPQMLAQKTDQILLSAYQKNQGNISQTAQELGISRNTLYRRLKKAGVLGDSAQ